MYYVDRLRGLAVSEAVEAATKCCIAARVMRQWLVLLSEARLLDLSYLGEVVMFG